MLMDAAKLSFKRQEETAAANKMASRGNTQDVSGTFSIVSLKMEIVPIPKIPAALE